jgi:Ca-activated chloride channel family protein
MPFATPLALLALLFVPAVVAMYLLRLRRTRTIVPSTLLWQRLAADVEANAPWQRLRRSLLFLLQLLLVIILAFLAARPFLERPAGLARDIVLIVDTSASMAATDVAPDRLGAARAAALEALKDLPAGGKVSVIEAGRTARIVAAGTSDLGRVRQAIDSIRPTASRGDLGDALALAQQLAVQSGDAEVLVATDAALAVPPTTRVEAPIRVLNVGDPKGSRNQAIVALAVRTAPSGVSRSVFISLANLDLEAATRRVEVWGDDRLVEARTVKIDAQSRSDVIVDNVGDADHPVSVVDVRLVAADETTGTRPDLLATDDRAWAVVPPDRQRNILIVGEGDPYLETALSYLPHSRLFGLKPSQYPGGAVRTDGTSWDLIVFDGTLPATLPPTPILAIAPPATSGLGEVSGTLKNPAIGSLGTDEPVLRYVDLSTTHIASAKQLVLPAWARTVIPGPKGAPLLYSGIRAGLPAAVLAFAPRESDLPLQVGFPILIANLTGELLGGSSAPAAAVKPGDPVALSVPRGATSLRVARPDGTTVELAPGTAGGLTVTFTQTDQLGVYTATPIFPPSASTPPSAGPSATTTPSPSPAASGSGAVPAANPSGPPGGVGADPTLPILFAVDLFDVDESAIAPGPNRILEDLGRARPAPGASGAPGSGADVPADRPAARDELWIPIVLLVLVGLCVEWTLYHRDAVQRAWRGITGRLRRPAGSGT